LADQFCEEQGNAARTAAHIEHLRFRHNASLLKKSFRWQVLQLPEPLQSLLLSCSMSHDITGIRFAVCTLHRNSSYYFCSNARSFSLL
jgi:hypothetical protein